MNKDLEKSILASLKILSQHRGEPQKRFFSIDSNPAEIQTVLKMETRVSLRNLTGQIFRILDFKTCPKKIIPNNDIFTRF
jgi:hypothetical protein